MINSLKAFHKNNKEVCARGDGFSIDPRLLVEQDGFNPRDYTDPDVIDHITKLKHAYINGRYVPPMIVTVIDGDVVVREGHCRRRAVLMAIDEGHDIKRVRVEEYRGDDVEQVALILTSNDGLKLKTLQRAEVISRLKAYGLNDTEISKKIGCTSTQVARYLTMLQMPHELKELVNADRISATYALQLFTELGAKAATEKAKKGLETGVKKVTPRVVNAVNAKKRLTPKMTRHINDSLLAISDVFDTEIPDDYTGNVKITISVDKFRALEEAVKLIEGVASNDA